MLIAHATLPPIAEIRCTNCNHNEKFTLNFLQKQGIKDEYALATIMGNIKQESGFVSNICEGGARTSYTGCRYGGYGLIQWASTKRYYGLGSFASRYGGDPSSLSTQLRYMVNEYQWKKALPGFKTPGKSISYYMNHAYTWLGWGIHGNRTYYAKQYLDKFTM